MFYFRQKWYLGSIDRFSTLLKSDPDYTARDNVYFYLAESYVKSKREAEALPLYEKLVNEFDKSEHLQDAQRRISELKAQAANKS
jgi:outer membrane protein assembly factor BamD (BamD/ComL family)